MSRNLAQRFTGGLLYLFHGEKLPLFSNSSSPAANRHNENLMCHFLLWLQLRQFPSLIWFNKKKKIFKTSTNDKSMKIIFKGQKQFN